MKNNIKLSFLAVFLLFSYGVNALEPGQSAPKKIYSVGDSITRAFNAYLPNDNPNISWTNGYYGFWQRLLGLPNINSHYQRIISAYGRFGSSNVTTAAMGARMSDFPAMALNVAGRGSTYVPVLLGANDICSSSIMNFPEDDVFASNFRTGMNNLVENLPSGATIYVAAIPDIEQVYQVGLNKDALGFVSCPLVWAINDICQSMLSWANTDTEREYVTSRIQGYNGIMKDIIQLEYQPISSATGLFFSYTGVSNEPFTASELSDIDCFHPSELGQQTLSSKTWQDGPFSN